MSSLHIKVRQIKYLYPLDINYLDASCVLIIKFLMNGYKENLTLSHKTFSCKVVYLVKGWVLSKPPELGIITWTKKGMPYIRLGLSLSFGAKSFVSTLNSQLLVQLVGSLIPFFWTFFLHLLETDICAYGILIVWVVWDRDEEVIGSLYISSSPKAIVSYMKLDSSLSSCLKQFRY